jgi:hypothetical protein
LTKLVLWEAFGGVYCRFVLNDGEYCLEEKRFKGSMLRRRWIHRQRESKILEPL